MEFPANCLEPFFVVVMNIALAVLAGASLLNTDVTDARLRRIAEIGCLALGIGLVGKMVAMTAAIVESSFSVLLSNIGLMLTQTHIGLMFWLALSAWLLILYAMLQARRVESLRRTPKLMLLLGMVVFSFARAASSHAGEEGLFSFAVLIHAAHMMAGAAWLGAVGRYLWVVRSVSDEQAVMMIHNLSRFVTLILFVMVGTGMMDATRMLMMSVLHSANGGAAITQFWSSNYMHVFEAKFILVASIMVLGGFNRWYFVPRIERGERWANNVLFHVVSIEALTLLGVMIVASQLGVSAPE